MAKQVGARTLISPTHIGSRTWIMPLDNILKCNVDAAVIDRFPHIGYGCVLRDSNGIVIAATHGILQGNFNSTVNEALSIREALGWLKSLDYSHIIVESDALLIMEALNKSANHAAHVLAREAVSMSGILGRVTLHSLLL
ncbi:uncharacterized protein [Henckelia pumila]|uniref:uncharacterized protein n=1 Tax=Henckelia pumila TaxID=405737 RepID=UPI003C6DFF92